MNYIYIFFHSFATLHTKSNSSTDLLHAAPLVTCKICNLLVAVKNESDFLPVKYRFFTGKKTILHHYRRRVWPAATAVSLVI